MLQLAAAMLSSLALAADESSPGVYEARGAMSCVAKSALDEARVFVPLPLDDREQAPLSYELVTRPRERLKSAVASRDTLGNAVLEIVIGPLESGEPVEIEWTAMVLVGARDFSHVPEEAEIGSEIPEDVRPWLRATRSAQSNDARIVAEAREIRGKRKKVLDVVRATLRRASTIYSKQNGHGTALDAVQALDKQGSCTSAANLVTALLRANGIPARILAGYATWYGPHQTHFVVEAFVPGYGWYPVESTRCLEPWPPSGQIQVSIVPPEHEDRSQARYFAADGVPYLTLDEAPECRGRFTLLGTIDESRGCDHVAKIASSLPAKSDDWPRALEAAHERWRSWLDAKPVLDAQHRFATAFTAKDADQSNLTALIRKLGR